MRQTLNAITTRLQEVLPAGEVFKIGEAPETAQRFVVVHLQRNTESVRYTQWPDRLIFEIVVNCYGNSVDEALWRQERVFTALDKWQPAIGGYKTQRCRHAYSVAVDVDDSTSPPLYFGSEHFTVRIDPV